MSLSFIGRQAELKQLLELTEKNTASFVVVKGRRRIGKSRLIQEFGKHFEQYYSFIGLPPEKHTTTSHQLNEFSRQVARQFNTSFARYDDWSDLLWAVGERLLSGKILLLFDEISWMGSKDPTFLGKIKNFWDTQLKNNNKLIFVVCGSASSWIEKNILSSTGFVGRISLTLTLGELSLSDCNEFWPKNISAYEKFKVLAVTGGIPKYLEEVNFKHSAEENIKKLCFTRGGFLVEEFDQIFSDLFMRKTAFYKQIVRALSTGAKEQEEICTALNIARHGRISEYLHELELAGFIARDHTWNIKTSTDSRLRKYRLQDNYLRFYLKYIEKNLGSVDKILEKPYKSSNKIEKTNKNLSSFIKSGKNAPKIFNFTKKTLNQMTFFVDMLIVIPLHFSIPFWRNNYCTSLVFKTCNKGIAIVALVSYYSRVIDTFGQHLCLRNFISLTRSQSKFKWISKCIDKCMYFSCKATFAPP